MAIQRVKNKNGEWIIVGGIDRWVPLTIDSQMSDSSTNPVQNKIVKEYIDDIITNSEINVKADTAMSDSSTNPVQNKVIKEYVDNAVQNVEIDVDSALSSTSTNPVQNKVVKSYIDNAVNGVKVTIDSSLSSSSTNPVQNKVINSAINNKQDKIVSGTHIKTINDQSIVGSGNINIQTTVDTAMSSTSTNPVQNKVVNTALGNKVDKVSGKQLSTEDFTSAFKTKLEGIEAGAQKNVQSDWNITSETSGAFIKNKPVIDTAMSDSSTNLVQNKVIKKYIDDEITELENAIIDTEEVYAAAVNDLNTRILITETALSEECVVRESLQTEFQTFKTQVTENEEVWAIALTDINDRIDVNYQHGEDTYSTKDSLSIEIQTINTSILDNEEVIAATLTDLNNQIASLNAIIVELTTRIETLENA